MRHRHPRAAARYDPEARERRDHSERTSRSGVLMQNSVSRKGHRGEQWDGAETEGDHRERPRGSFPRRDRETERGVHESAGQQAVGRSEDQARPDVTLARRTGREPGQPRQLNSRLRQEAGHRRTEPDDEYRGKDLRKPCRPGKHGPCETRDGAKSRVGHELPCLPRRDVRGAPSARQRKRATHTDAVQATYEAHEGSGSEDLDQERRREGEVGRR